MATFFQPSSRQGTNMNLGRQFAGAFSQGMQRGVEVEPPSMEDAVATFLMNPTRGTFKMRMAGASRETVFIYPLCVIHVLGFTLLSIKKYCF